MCLLGKEHLLTHTLSKHIAVYLSCSTWFLSTTPGSLKKSLKNYALSSISASFLTTSLTKSLDLLAASSAP